MITQEFGSYTDLVSTACRSQNDPSRRIQTLNIMILEQILNTEFN